MATDSKNVSMTLSVDTIGTEGVAQLKNDIRDLAKQGADAAPEFAQLANEVEKLSNQSKLVAGLRSLSDEVERLSTETDKSRAETYKLGTEFGELKAKADAAKAAEAELKSQIDLLKTSNNELGISIQRLKVNTDEAGQKTDDFKAKLLAAKNEIIDNKEKILGLTAELAQAKTVTTDAAGALKKLGSEFNASASETRELESALRATSADLTKVRDGLEVSGISARNAAVAETELVATYQKSSAAIATLQTELAQKKQAQAEAAAQAKNAAEAEKKSASDAAAAAKAAAAEVEAAALRKIEAIKYEGNRLAQEWEQEKADAKAAADALNNAFSTVGVKSAAAIRDEITKVRESLHLLQTSGNLTGAELKQAMASAQAQINSLERDLREATGQMTLVDKVAKTFSGTLGQFTVANLAANAIMYLVQVVTGLGKAFIDTLFQTDQFRRGLNAVYGDSQLAASQMDYLRKVAMSSGVSMSSLTSEFVKFSAAMKSANVPLEQSNALFAAVTRASATLGLSADDTAGMLRALGQMASKGTVSMEELRQQLGDRLPGAMGLVAKGLGITEAQLNKLVESGNLAARDLFPALTTALQQLQGETDGLSNTWERFKNVLTLAAQSAGESGWTVMLSGAIKALGAVVGTVTIAISGFSEMVMLAGAAVVALYKSLTGDGKLAWEFFNNQVEKAGERLGNLKSAYDQMIEPQQTANASTAKLGVTVATVSDQLSQTDDKVRKLSEGYKLSAVAADLAGNATLNLSTNIVAYNAKAAELLHAQELTTEGLQKTAKAAKDEGDQLISLAKLTGDHSQLVIAEAKAVQLQAEALDKVALSQKAEVDILITQRQHIIDVANEQKRSAEEIKNLTRAIDEKIAKAAPELEQMTKAADAARTEATARVMQVEALKDHSKEIDSYKVKIDDLKTLEATLLQKQAEGRNVSDDLKRVRQELAKATALYNDGVKDSILNTEIELKQTVALTASKDAQSNVRIKHMETLIAEAKRTGDVVEVQRLETEVKKESILILERKRTLVEKEVQAKLAEIDAQRKLLTADTDENKAKLTLLDVEEKLAKARLESNKGIDEQIKGLKAEVAAVNSVTNAFKDLGVTSDAELRATAEKSFAAFEKIQSSGQASARELREAFKKFAEDAIKANDGVADEFVKTQASAHGLAVEVDSTGKAIVKAMNDGATATQSATGYMDAFKLSAMKATAELEKQNAELEKTIAAEEKALELKERVAALERKRKNVDKDGFELDSNGNRLVTEKENQRTVFDKAKSAGLTDAQALQIAETFIDEQGKYKNQGGEPSWSVALMKAINAMVLENARKNAAGSGGASGGGSGGGSGTAGTNNSGSTTHTVNVNLGGTPTTIATATENDAAKLTGLLTQLENALRRAA